MGFRNPARGVRPGDLDALAARVDTVEATAERKARVFTNPSTDPPVAEGPNDLWMVIDQGTLMRRATAAGPDTWQDLWDFGSSVDSIVAGGMGRAVFPHRLSGTPTAITVQNRANAIAQQWQLFSKGASSFQVTFRDGGGALVPDGTAVAVDYIAVA